jgi:archaellum biogenesis protein FlaJ (TadC family)
MIEWLHSNESVIWWLAASSVITFVLSLILVPMMVVRIPSDYFSYKKRHPKKPEKYPPAIRIVLLVLKNILGIVLILAGMLMLVLPGQGLFTMFVGIMMMNFPGKYKLERWIVARGPILKSINWMRRQAGHEPLKTYNDDGHTSPDY